MTGKRVKNRVDMRAVSREVLTRRLRRRMKRDRASQPVGKAKR